jgi:hypothetical protein
MRKYLLLLIVSIGFLHGAERYSKYFIAIKKNQGEVLKSLHEHSSFVPPTKLLYADPMLFKWNQVNYLFFETYDYKKGTIDCVTIDDKLNLSEPIHVLNLECHLSFPALFEEEGTIYMTPETISLREVSLYEATDFPKGWVKKRVLVSGRDYTDPILFKLNGYYWLFTAVNTSELCIFYAKTLSCVFLPHPVNHKRIQGRNAGMLFTLENKLIRPVMDCSKIYGGAMILKEIVELTPTSFIEKEITRIEPNWAPGLNGTHTFNMNEDLVVYDGRRSILPSEDILYSAEFPTDLKTIPDERLWLEKSYLPTCSGRMLFIGVGSYTVNYPYYTKTPSLFETIDCLEERAQYGSPFKHHVSDLLLFEPEYLYDQVSFFGILGYPVLKYAPFITDESIHQVLEKVHSFVKIGGVLQIGANYSDKEPYTTQFWLQKFKEHYEKKYTTLSLVLSPLSVIWVGKKLRN